MSEISASHHLESVIGTRVAHAVDEEAKATTETCAVVDFGKGLERNCQWRRRGIVEVKWRKRSTLGGGGRYTRDIVDLGVAVDVNAITEGCRHAIFD